MLLIQDRTMADVLAPPSTQHFRGWFFEMYPQLIEFEEQRRPDPSHLEASLAEAGFTLDSTHRIAEERRTYPDVGALRSDLLSRTGRSILHELDDDQLRRLVDRICGEFEACGSGDPICEVDYWTIWKATPTRRRD